VSQKQDAIANDPTRGGTPRRLAAQPTVIGESCRLTGDLVLEGDAVILGTVEGQVAISGRLDIGQSGVIKGSIRAAVAELAGQVEGDAICDSEFHISSTGTLFGNIYARALHVNDGATCRGHCIVGQNALDAVDQADEDAEYIRNGAGDAPATIGRIATSANAGENTERIETKSSSVAGLMRRKSPILQRSGTSQGNGERRPASAAG